MDWNSNAVAYGYQYCGFACQSLYRGYWLTFSDNQGAYPTNPQGASDAFNPTFYGTRVVSSDSGGRIFVQPDVPEAPFTSSYESWLSADNLYLSRAEVSPANNQVAVEWSKTGGEEGIIIAQHDGTVPGGLAADCTLTVAAHSGNLTFSPDGSQTAWRDDEGIKVAGVPNMAAGRSACTLTAPAHVISSSGTQPSFAARRRRHGHQGAQDHAGRPRDARGVRQGPDAEGRRAKARADRRLRLDPAKVARKVGLRGKASAARLKATGSAAASATVVARGTTKAKRAGMVKIRLKPTKAAKRAAKRLRKVVLIKVSQAGAAGTAKVKLR